MEREFCFLVSQVGYIPPERTSEYGVAGASPW
jgi:hypothetical protein